MLDEKMNFYHKFSIVCPFYNSRRFIVEAVESVLHQDYKNWELILVNDGSTDDSVDLISKYANNDNRIKIFNIENSGTFLARNIGVTRATGDYILFLDSDDYLASNTLSSLNHEIKNSGAQIVYFNIETFSFGSLPKKVLIQINQRNLISDHLNIIKETFLDHEYGYGVCGCCFAKFLFDDLSMPQIEGIKSAEDILLAYFLFIKAIPVLFLPDVFYYYRMNESSTTHNMTLKDYWDCTRVFIIVYGDIIKKFSNRTQLMCNNKIFWGSFSFITHAPRLTTFSDFRSKCKELRNSDYYNVFIKKYSYPGKKIMIVKTLLNIRFYSFAYFLLKHFY